MKYSWIFFYFPSLKKFFEIFIFNKISNNIIIFQGAKVLHYIYASKRI